LDTIKEGLLPVINPLDTIKRGPQDNNFGVWLYNRIPHIHVYVLLSIIDHKIFVVKYFIAGQ